MNIYKIALFLTALVLMASCQKDILAPETTGVPEGVQTTVELKLKPSKMEVQTRGMLTEAKEKEVLSIAVFIFDQSGFILSSAIHENVLAHVTGGLLGVDAGASMKIPAISGPSRQIYAIANYDADEIESLKSVSTVDDLKQLIVHLYANPIYREFGLVKVGTTTQDIHVNGAQVAIELKYTTAKITLNVVNKSTDFSVAHWGIGNVASKSYLMERPYDATNTNLNDAVDQQNEKDFYNDFVNQALPFDSGDSGLGTAAGKNYQVSFYLAENRQGTKPLNEKKPLEPPYTGLAANDYKIKSWDAPSTASYIVITGQQNNSRAVHIKHYLGSNSYDNYDVSRGVHYTYTITINNLNDINIDTNVESYEDPITVDAGSDLESLDAHACSRVFELHTEANFPAGTKITAELANFANSTDYPSWLKISPVSLVSSQIVDPASSQKIRNWQQSGVNWSYVRTKFIPHSSKRALGYTNPYANFSFFGDVTAQPQLVDSENPDYVDGKDSYPAYDNELPYAWAVRRMCSKITDIPVNTAQSIKLFIYADEYELDGNDKRSAVLRITHEYGGVKSTKIYNIVQYAPIQFMGLPGENTIMLVENGEEYAHMLQTELSMNLQMLAGMQWGSYKGVATSPNDGALNTLQGVYSRVNSATDYSVNEYLKKYGSMGGQWSIAGNGEIPEGVAKSPILGAPFYSFYAGADDDYFNATYNSTAARYCHEKNWDENGNGQIDPSEAKWYLPSQQELQLFWTYHEKLGLDKDYYWSSTTADDDKAYAIAAVESTSDPKYVYYGTQQKLSKIATAGLNRPRVRCVRRIEAAAANVKRYMPVVVFENKALLVDCSNITSEMYTTVSKYGISQNNQGAILKANSKVYKKLQVQLTQPEAVQYSPLHLDGGKCDESKGWRLPTQREMLLIWSVKDQIASKAGASFANFNNGLYWTMTRGVAKQYVVDFTTGLALYDDYSLKSSDKLNYRCVKEVF